jgi:hypothetical protein
MIPDDVSVGPITIYSDVTASSEFVIDNSRDLVNYMLSQFNLSPIKSQIRKDLDKNSASALRRVKSKLNGTMKVIQGMF